MTKPTGVRGTIKVYALPTNTGETVHYFGNHWKNSAYSYPMSLAEGKLFGSTVAHDTLDHSRANWTRTYISWFDEFTALGAGAYRLDSRGDTVTELSYLFGDFMNYRDGCTNLGWPADRIVTKLHPEVVQAMESGKWVGDFTFSSEEYEYLLHALNYAYDLGYRRNQKRYGSASDADCVFKTMEDCAQTLLQQLQWHDNHGILPIVGYLQFDTVTLQYNSHVRNVTEEELWEYSALSDNIDGY